DPDPGDHLLVQGVQHGLTSSRVSNGDLSTAAAGVRSIAYVRANAVPHTNVSLAGWPVGLARRSIMEAARRLGVAIHDSVVVGDSVWDLLAARRAWALGVGLLSGGYGQDELERAGAYRVYQDPADLLRHLDEVGVRVAESTERGK